MSAPWLSVLMPVFNGAAMLERTLASVVDQAEGIEIILVDQGSRDESVAIARTFQDRLDLRIIPAPDNKNWVQNTNLALQHARAPRATLLHQDDLWRPGRAALLQEMFAAYPEAALWVHGSDYVDAQARVIGALSPAFGPTRRIVPKPEALARLIVQNTIPIPSAAFPTEAAQSLGGLDEALWYTADWHLWLGLAGLGDTAWSPEKMTAFRLHAGSLTVSGSKDLADFEAQLEAPVARHAAALSDADRARCLKLARASNGVNVWLASVFHADRRPMWPVLARVLALGPLGWGPFLRDSRLVQRIRPRLSLRRKNNEVPT